MILLSLLNRFLCKDEKLSAPGEIRIAQFHLPGLDGKPRFGSLVKHIGIPVNRTLAISMARHRSSGALLSLYVFKDEVGFAPLGHASVNQFRDVRMSQLAQNPALSLKSFSRSLRGKRKMQKLDPDLAFESAINPLGKPHVAHATLADARDELVCAYLLTD